MLLQPTLQIEDCLALSARKLISSTPIVVLHPVTLLRESFTTHAAPEREVGVSDNHVVFQAFGRMQIFPAKLSKGCWCDPHI